MTYTILTYSSRSGSTFLAKKLSKSYDVCIVPEFQCAYKILSLSPDGPIIRDRLIGMIRADPQLDWIPDSALGDIDGADIAPGDAVRWIAQMYRQNVGHGSEDYLLKLGGMAHLWPVVRRHLPGVRGLNVVRDGRAVVNSLLSSPSPSLADGVDMGYGDPIWAARTWVRDVNAQLKCVERFPSEFRSFNYEDLVTTPGECLKDIAARFGWSEDSSLDTFAVAGAENELHQNIDSGALAERITAWRSELSRSDRIAIESIAGEELTRLGYGDMAHAGLAERFGSMSRAQGNHVVRQARGWALRVKRLRSVSDVSAKIRRRVVSRTAWKR